MTTGLYAGILLLVYVALSFNVILRRVKTRTLFGDNNDPSMVRAVRIHGNFAEYVPFILLGMMLYEMQAGSLYILHALGIVLIAARLAHIYGLFTGQVWARVAGTAGTQSVMAVTALLLIARAFKVLPLL